MQLLLFIRERFGIRNMYNKNLISDTVPTSCGYSYGVELATCLLDCRFVGTGQVGQESPGLQQLGNLLRGHQFAKGWGRYTVDDCSQKRPLACSQHVNLEEEHRSRRHDERWFQRCPRCRRVALHGSPWRTYCCRRKRYRQGLCHAWVAGFFFFFWLLRLRQNITRNQKILWDIC